MNWHYAINGESRGPVNDEELQRLVQQGAINRETLVWREGMANWAPYSGTASSTLAVPAAGVQDGVACAMCGRVISRNDTFILSGMSYCAACKPQVVQRLKEGIGIAGSAAEEMRKTHISHEASVKSIGLLYFFGGGAMLVGGLATAVAILASTKELEALIIALALLVFGAGYIFVGVGIRRLRQWARVVAGILSGIGLVGFPLGTLISGYFLYLLFSKKGTTVFSPEYQDVILQTPHIKYKTSIVVWIFLGILVAVIVAVLATAFLSKR